MSGLSPRLIGAIGGAVALIIFVIVALGWRSERNELRDWRGVTVTATREASGQPRLAIAAVPQQIRLLGQARIDLEYAVDDQNKRIRAMAAADVEHQAAAAKARQDAQEAQRGRSAVIDRLGRSASAPAPSAAQCEPSATLKEYWK